MKVRSKEPYWLLKNGIMNSYPSLRDNIECDLLIVGGGLTGALMAYQFSGEGYRTVLIDKRDIGTGSTCSTTSMVQYEIDEPLHGLMDIIGQKAAVEIYRECVNSVRKLGAIANELGLPCGFQFKESLHFAHNNQEASGLRRELKYRKLAGIETRWMTKMEIRSKYGVKSEGGIWSETAASMDAYQMTHGLMQFAKEKFGLNIYDHVAIKSVLHHNTKNVVLVDPAAQIECSHIVYATGYESHELVGQHVDIGKLVSTYACISEPITSLPEVLTNTLFWNTEDPYFYFRTTEDNRLLVGGLDENFNNPELRDALIDKKEEALVNGIREKIPGIDFVADFTWAGTFGATKDSLPYVGSHPDYPDSYFMLGFGGNGITFSVMGMKILSDAVAKRKNIFLDYFRFDR